MFKSMSMHKRDSKGIVKLEFVTPCLVFRAQYQKNPTSPKSRLGVTKRICSTVTSALYTISLSLIVLLLYVFSLLVTL